MKNLFAAVAVIGVLSASTASAAIVGTFDFNGLNAVPAVVGDTYIDFGDPFSYITSGCDGNAVTPCAFVAGNGAIDVSGATGIFVGASTGTVKDLTLPLQPPGVPFVLPNFIVLNERPQFNFTLTNIDAPGFILSGSTIVGLFGGGTVTGGGLTNATFRIAFSTQFNETQAALLARIDDEMPARNTYSATVTVEDQATVPEPANMALLGMILSSAAFAIRRRKAQQ